IVIACDSFKGSVSSVEAGEAVAAGLRDVWPKAEVIVIPMADGGEGTADTMARIVGAEPHYCTAHDPLGNIIDTRYFIRDDHAYIDTAVASGLTLIDDSRRNPAVTTSYGTGELILDALHYGCRHIYLGLGGSATNDAGVGLLNALGYRFSDKNGHTVGYGGYEVGRITGINNSQRTPLLDGVTVTAICDVSNPLCGSSGASYVFGPQKGATPQMIRQLDSALSLFAKVVEGHIGRDLSQTPAAGAAGGIGFALKALLGAQIRPGAETILDLCRFDDLIADADLVITGEGRLDTQTLMGKAPAAVLRRALAYNIPVIAIGGTIDPNSGSQLKEAGFSRLYAISDPALTLEQNMTRETTLRNIRRVITTIYDPIT
ncbi:MAG: glycerate kinase, partial [Muribaculaceae bacterium]|nr:glycerate kinase [Muribaculaceae bacterium]